MRVESDRERLVSASKERETVNESRRRKDVTGREELTGEEDEEQSQTEKGIRDERRIDEEK